VHKLLIFGEAKSTVSTRAAHHTAFGLQ